MNARLLASSCFTTPISAAGHLQHYFLRQKLTEASGPVVVAIGAISIAVVTYECADEKHAFQVCCHAVAPIAIACEEVGP